MYEWARSDKGKYYISFFLLRLPFLKDIVLRAELARFCRTVVLLLRGGVSIVRALKISIPILSNELIKKQLSECQENLTSGGSFGEGLKKASDIPEMMGHLIAVGEESGNITEVLGEVAETYEQETDEQVKILTTLLEPIMILLVGIIIGFIVFAMLLPIFQMDFLSQ